MSYAKVLEGFIRLFPRKIKVKLLDYDTREFIGSCKMSVEQLPEKFKRPTFLDVLNQKWRILKADLVKSEDFLFTRNLTLHVRLADSNVTADLGYLVPTISGRLPETSNEYSSNEFIMDLSQDDWLQIQLLPHSMIVEIQEEIKSIDAILRPAKGGNLLFGYEKLHSRKAWDSNDLAIPFESFCSKVNTIQGGDIRFSNTPGKVIKNGFVIKSDNWIYYGIMDGNFIAYLGLQHFDFVDDEIVNILSELNLVLVDWCKGKIITNETFDSEAGSLNMNEGELPIF